MEYDFFMGLAVFSALPVAAAVAFLCAPLEAQSRPPESNPKRLIEKADRLAWKLWQLHRSANPARHTTKRSQLTGPASSALAN